MPEANRELRQARERQRSTTSPGDGLSRQELAELVNARLNEKTGKRYELDANYIGKLERGVIRWPQRQYREALRTVLGAATDRELGFRRPRREDTTVTDVNRGHFLRMAAGVAGAAVLPGADRVLAAPNGRSDLEYVQAFAWELWQRSTEALHLSQLPPPLARAVVRLCTARRQDESCPIRSAGDGYYRLAHRDHLDLFVAQRIYGAVAVGDHGRLAVGQTSHVTDLMLRDMIAGDPEGARRLDTWMRSGADPVLRVNCAGILAKLGVVPIVDEVVSTLKADRDTRHLYLTAVAARVLGLRWGEASRLAAALSYRPGRVPELLPAGRAADSVRKLADEAGKSRDGAARWCGVALLAPVRQAAPDLVRQALLRAVHTEQSRENLRAIATVLAGGDPVTT